MYCYIVYITFTEYILHNKHVGCHFYHFLILSHTFVSITYHVRLAYTDCMESLITLNSKLHLVLFDYFIRLLNIILIVNVKVLIGYKYCCVPCLLLYRKLYADIFVVFRPSDVILLRFKL